MIWFPFSWRKQMCRTWGDGFVILHNLEAGCLFCNWCLTLHTCSPGSQSTSTFHRASPSVNRSVHCQSYDCVCINKLFPINRVPHMLTVPNGTLVRSVNCVCVDWTSSDDLPAPFSPLRSVCEVPWLYMKCAIVWSSVILLRRNF
jgi:hypothetical protein